MKLFYNIGIRMYWLAAWTISPWNMKARLWIDGRKNWLEGLKKAMASEDRVIWLHCASLGEFEQGRPVLEAIRKQCPGYKILLTFFSPSGYEKRRHYEGADYVMYLPLDTKRNAQKLLSHLNVEIAMFVKYEFWYHYLHSLNRREVTLYLISGNFRPDQIFFKWYGGWYRKFLGFFTHIFVQKENSKRLLEQIGINGVTVAGDTRFDRVLQVAETEYRNETIDQFTRISHTIVAGSTWEADEQLLEQAYRELPADLKWIIAPHELSGDHLAKLRKRFPKSVLFTEMGQVFPTGTRVIIVDTIGQLSYLYRYGTLSYIGGGFGKGIHNILEAAIYGLPVLFGPNHKKFAEANELSSLGGAFPVRSISELLSTIRKQLENPELLKTTSRISRSYVLERVGATSVIVEELCKKTGANMF